MARARSSPGRAVGRREAVGSPVAPGRAGRRAAFTLVEVLMASSVLTLVVGALVLPFSLAAEHQQLDARRTAAAALATQMMERLTVRGYDQVLAMDGYAETGAAITDVAGQPMNDASLAGFTVRVDAAEVPIPVGGQTVDEASKFCLATVTVSHAELGDVKLNRLFAR